MSNVEKVQKVKKEKAPPKPRQPRAKKAPPTKEEELKRLQDEAAELKQILKDLKEDQNKVSNLALVEVPDLIIDAIEDLEEELQDKEDQCAQLLLTPVLEIV